MDHTRDLLLALMKRDGDNPNSLSAKVRNKTQQPQIFRFLTGAAAEPRRKTLQPIADHYGVPLEAFYHPQLAKAIYENLQSGAPLMQDVRVEALESTRVVAMPAINTTEPTGFRQSLQRLDDLIGAIAPVLQSTARDAVVKWASAKASLNETAAALDALAAAPFPNDARAANSSLPTKKRSFRKIVPQSAQLYLFPSGLPMV